ncbi:MAG: hypothetical protein AAGD25_09530 [Cyanobacteria bacterium P01_F01_bin.150]
MRKNHQWAIGQRLLSLLDDNAVSQTTGLAVDIIQKLRQGS